MIRAGQAPGTVVRCTVTDTLAGGTPAFGFFFAASLDEDRLAQGLAFALGRVPVFAGRLRQRGAELDIVCNDAGVPMTVVGLSYTLADAIARMTLPGSGLIGHVDPVITRHGTAPLMNVQVSRLADGGTVLCCSWDHVLGDMDSFMLLMRSWSAFVQGEEPPPVVTVEDRAGYLDAFLPEKDCGRPSYRIVDAEESAEISGVLNSSMLANRLVQIYFGAAEVTRMRESYSATAQCALSANDVLSAHVIDTILRLDGDHETRFMVTPVNLRRRLGVPEGTVGNLFGEICVPCSTQDGPESLAAGIRSALGGFIESHLSARTNRAFIEAHGAARLSDCVPAGMDPRRRTFFVSNAARTGIYDLVFADCRPVFAGLNVPLPLARIGWITEGFGGDGYLFLIGVPAALAARLRGAVGQEALHHFREPADTLPPLAGAVRRLA
jgi:hypothetical protein